MKVNTLHYRPEIDGLRALAVISVLLFHVGIDSFRGGYVGVDVFFVISGFLITNIILTDVEKGTFKLYNFYQRRIRRIAPALIFVVIISIPFSWYILLPNDFKDFSQSLVAVSTFTSNILFWREVDYFETQAELKPLLHTWSLAIEEQFYIIYPLILLFLFKFNKNIIFSTLVILLMLSFFLCIETNYYNPKTSFYFIHTRAWELIMGCLLAFNIQYKFIKKMSFRSNQLLSLAGLFLIFFSILQFDHKTSFPSWYTLLPTIGTLLILNCAVDNTIVKKILQTSFLVKIGLISYSAYLWHFPIIAYTKYFYVTEISDQHKLILFISFFPIAFLSWKYIEIPFRNHQKIKSIFVILLAFIFSFIIFTIGILGHVNNGYQNRIPPKDLHANFYRDLTSNQITMVAKGVNGKFCSSSTPSICHVNNAIGKRVLLLGDSHSADFSYYYKKYSVSNNLNAWQMSALGCNFTFQEFTNKKNCKKAFNFLKKKLSEKKFDLIIFIASDYGTEKLSFFKDFLLSLKKKDNDVIFFTPRPTFNILIPNALKFNKTNEIKEKKPQNDNKLKNFLIQNGIKVFDQNKILSEMFCLKQNKCDNFIYKKRALYRDNNHLSDYGAYSIFQKLVSSNLIDLD